tara:strand:+ start:144 stop:320 length:177 start_codon:yes stop_codon:yes gene_type:complete
MRDLDGMVQFLNSCIEMEVRSERIEKEDKKSAEAIIREWQGASAADTLYLTTDSFVRQ